MNRSHPIRLVCFDLGGVVFRIHPDLPAALAHVHADTDPDALRQRLARDPAVQQTIYRVETGKVSMDQACAELQQHLGVPAQRILLAVEHWILGLYDGIESLITQLNNRGLLTCCLSNTNAYHWRQLYDQPDHRRCLQRLHHRFASHLLGLAKPDPAIYQYVEQHLQLPGRAIAYFDDHQQHVNAAAARQWHSFRIDPDDNPPQQIRRILTRMGMLDGPD